MRMAISMFSEAWFLPLFRAKQNMYHRGLSIFGRRRDPPTIVLETAFFSQKISLCTLFCYFPLIGFIPLLLCFGEYLLFIRKPVKPTLAKALLKPNTPMIFLFQKFQNRCSTISKIFGHGPVWVVPPSVNKSLNSCQK